jgi:hypothetical protein
LRYQSSWVFAHIGTATSLPFHVAPFTAGSRAPSEKLRAWPSGIGARNSASANSGTNTGSRLIKSIDVSFAASRRSNCSRWSLALRGSTNVSILYRPRAASVQR